MPTEQLTACRNFHDYYHISGIRCCWKDKKLLNMPKNVTTYHGVYKEKHEPYVYQEI